MSMTRNFDATIKTSPRTARKDTGARQPDSQNVTFGKCELCVWSILIIWGVIYLCSNFTSFSFLTVKIWYVFVSSAKDWFDSSFLRCEEFVLIFNKCEELVPVLHNSKV